MNLSNLKFNLKIGNRPEARLFIKYHKELGLSDTLLGNEYIIDNNLYIFIGLVSQNAPDFTYINKFCNTKYTNDNIIKFKAVFLYKDDFSKIYKKNAQEIRLYKSLKFFAI